jgi:hypothetical protein
MNAEACRLGNHREYTGVGFASEHADSLLCLAVVLQTVQTNLLPGGDSLAVTGDNRLLYVHLLADHLLNTRLGRATAAFAGECAVLGCNQTT